MRKTLIVALLLCICSMPMKGSANMYNCGYDCGCCPCNDWSGVYFGLNGGYGWGEVKNSFERDGVGGPTVGGTGGGLFAPFATGGSFKHHWRGGIFGGHIGFNRQCCSFVWGLEGAFEGSWLDKSSSNEFSPPVAASGATYKTEMQWFATLTPRLGYAWCDWLLYAKGGLAAARLRSKLTGNTAVTGSANPPPFSFHRTQDHIGWTVGAGLEYLWCCNWILGVEYDYYHLSKPTYGGKVSPDTLWPVDYTVRPYFHNVLFRLSYKI